MRVPFSPNYFDSFRVQEACEKYVFLLAKLCGLRSGGWEVNVRVGTSFICALEGPDSLWTHQFIMGCDPVSLELIFVIVKGARDKELRDNVRSLCDL